MNDQLDPQVVALARAIKKNETGEGDTYNAPTGPDGEQGAYRWVRNAKMDNWASGAKRFLGDPNAPMSIDNQNKVAYAQIKAYKDQGYNPAQIASLWNSGSPNHVNDNYAGTSPGGAKYNTSKYAQNVYQDYLRYKGGQAAPATPPVQNQFVNPNAAPQSGPTFVQPPAPVASTDTTGTGAAPDAAQPKSFLDHAADFGKGAMGVLRTAEAPFLGVAAIPTQLLAKGLGQEDPFKRGIGVGLAGTTPETTGTPGDVSELDLERKAGDIAQVGSYFVPGSGVLSAVGAGVLQGAGGAMSQKADLGTVAAQGAIGGAIGGGTALLAKGIGYGLHKASDFLTGESGNKAVQGIKNAYASALNLNASERGFESRSGKDLAQVLLDNQAPLSKYENGTLDASGAIQKLQDALGPLNAQASDILDHPQGVVKNIDFGDVFNAAKARIQKLNINPTEQKAAINLLQQNIDDAAEKYGSSVAPAVADTAKQAFQGSAFRKALTSSDQLQGNVSYIVSDELRKATEQAVKGTDTAVNLGALNLQRSALVDAIKRLTSLDGARAIRGGRAGNMVGGIVGTIIGSNTGGIAGGIAGDYFGNKVASLINDPAFKIAVATQKAGLLGKGARLLGPASVPVGNVVGKVGTGVSNLARPAGLVANLLTKPK